jgi:quercetin dioxygenase-like cupin family protein
MSWFGRNSDKIYEAAIRSMEKLHKRVNSNIPDYNPFELPVIKEFVSYPENALSSGSIKQRLLRKTSKLRVYELVYKNKAQLQEHTHYGFYEFVYVSAGTFITRNGDAYVKGDAFILDGYGVHALKCLTDSGALLVGFSKDKFRLDVSILTQYL